MTNTVTMPVVKEERMFAAPADNRWRVENSGCYRKVLGHIPHEALQARFLVPSQDFIWHRFVAENSRPISKHAVNEGVSPRKPILGVIAQGDVQHREGTEKLFWRHHCLQTHDR